MNSFLELHSDSDYRNVSRPYYTGTWEMIQVASDYLIPFQFELADSGFKIYAVDTNGDSTDITTYFDQAQKITSWTDSGSGLSATGPVINSWTIAAGDYITSNTFGLSNGETFHLQVDPTAFSAPGDMLVSLRKGAATIWSDTMDDFTDARVDADETTSTYSLRITYTSGPGPETATSNTPFVGRTDLVKEASGNLYWYTGAQLSSTITGAFYIRVGTSFYSDWMDACGFTGKMKYKISSSYDFGGIKYDEGYAQWFYKNASVRRGPRGEIEQVGSQRNGVLILEKSVAAVRYVIRMKCTEPEYEALIHSIGGTVEITDQFGKVYDATNIEISDPTWYRMNGIVEVSFVDTNNINVWTKNNSSL